MPRVALTNEDGSLFGAVADWVNGVVNAVRWDEPQSLGSTDSLDTLTTPGLYNNASSSTGGLPFSGLFSISVEKAGSSSTIIQRAVSWNDRTEWRRALKSGVWDAWEKTPDAEDVQEKVNNGIATRLLIRHVNGGIDLNTLTSSEDVVLTSMTGVTNAPSNSLGYVTVRSSTWGVSQVFRSAIRDQGDAWARRYASNAWSAWTPIGPVTAAPASSVSFNDLRSLTTYPIQSTTHPSQPAARPGTLEVIPSTGFVLQRFTTWDAEPLVFQRRASSATAWSTWAQMPSRAELDTISDKADQALATSSTANLGVVPRGAVETLPATVETVEARDVFGALSKDRTHGWTCYNSTLRESWDDGVTWTDLYSFAGNSMETTMELGDGELLVTGHNGATNRRKVWKSTGYGTANLTFTEVMEARVAGVKFTSSWSQSEYGRIVLLNEYGPKSGATWAGVDGVVPEGNNARYTYLSTDYGATWRIIFDLNDYLYNDRGLTEVDGQHLHGVLWDQYWDRIWVSFGDDTDGVVYSDDLGDTWQTAVWSPVASSATQGVGLIALPKCVLMGSDNYNPSTVYRINRSEGKHKTGGYTLDNAWQFTGGGKHLLQGKCRVDRRGDDAPTFLGFCAEGVAANSFVVGTLDGYTFSEVWRDPVQQNAGMGTRTVVGPTARGNIVISSADEKVAGMWSQITTKATGY